MPCQLRSDAHKVDYLQKAVTEFQDCSLIPIQNITSQGYSYNKFVIKLHESIQNLRQIRLLTGPKGNISGGYVIEGYSGFMTNLTRYGRNPRHIGRYNDRFRSHRSNQGRGQDFFFEIARKRNECHKGGAPNWKPGHRCAPSAMEGHTRYRIRKRESASHILAEFIKGEEDFTWNLDEGSNGVARSSEDNKELEEFESHFTQKKEPGADGYSPHTGNVVETAERDILLSHVTSAVGVSNQSVLDFRLGGKNYQ